MDNAVLGTRTTLGDVSGRAKTLARWKVIEQDEKAENTLQLNDHLPVSALHCRVGSLMSCVGRTRTCQMKYPGNSVWWPGATQPGRPGYRASCRDCVASSRPLAGLWSATLHNKQKFTRLRLLGHTKNRL